MDYIRVERFGNATCIKTVVGSSKGMPSVKALTPEYPPFVSITFLKDHTSLTKKR